MGTIEHGEPSQARLDAAAAVRRLIHAMAGHHGTDDELATLAETANSLANGLEQREQRVRSRETMLRYDQPVPEGGTLTCWPDCMIAGSAHPTGTGLAGRRLGELKVDYRQPVPLGEELEFRASVETPNGSIETV